MGKIKENVVKMKEFVNGNKHISVCDLANEVEIYLTHSKAF
jgi:hypothetical protein